MPAADLVEAWLYQMRSAPYSWDLLDNRGRRSPRERDTTSPPPVVGEPILSVFRVAVVEPGVGLTMISDGPPPTALTYDVHATSPTSSRLVVLASATTASMLGAALLAVCDLIMMTKQLRTFARYAEREATAAGATCLPTGGRGTAGVGRSPADTPGIRRRALKTAPCRAATTSGEPAAATCATHAPRAAGGRVGLVIRTARRRRPPSARPAAS